MSTIESKYDDHDLRLRERAGLLNRMSVSDWRAFFALCSKPFDGQTRNSGYVSDVLNTLAPAVPELPAAVLAAVKLNAYHYLLKKLLREPLPDTQGEIAGGRQFVGYHTREAASGLVRDMGEILKEGHNSAELKGCLPLLMDTLAVMRTEMLADAPDPDHFFFQTYIRLWEGWIAPLTGDAGSCAEELDRLLKAAGNKPSGINQYNLLSAQSSMLFGLSRDSEAISLLERLAEKHPVDEARLFQYLNELSRTQQWRRLAQWLTDTAHLFAGRSLRALTPFFAYWDEVIRQLPDTEEAMWRTLESLYPASKTLYMNKLYELGKWRKWMDIQLSTGSEPLDFRADTYKPIEKYEPELLLPYYHQAVERHVAAKSRDGYKLAVKLLKRLAKLYKKMKRDADWERFLDSFLNRHSRLRALHEEMRKGKLIE
ncbi:hypothetical protein KP806_16090 [Paenibacillus sp. N4]|uniref:hypothetical protein n=1 Tax=Paenibacillus vietnamensis TaxID=2590547 RepID=UPI001CD13096|nr:hypothetical protein [Paenibacillus vietnamensis]MCA0756577.1 hypothetical protein [Paenibacillus vietnamensis]